MKFFAFTVAAIVLVGCSEPEPKSNNGNNNLGCVSNTDCPVGQVCNDVAQCVAGDDCALDSDCDADEVCENSICIFTCASDADCAAGEVCGPRTAGNGMVCLAGGVNNINNTNNLNNTNNTNNNGTEYNFFMIEDTTFGEGCEVIDPGSDLQYVRITDANNTATLGYAQVRNLEFGPESNDYIDASILDGNPPTFAGDCTDDFTDQSVVAMGCGGRFIFQPIDGTLTPMVLVPGEHSVYVGEYGVECNGSADDTYQVLGCEDGVGAGQGDFGACTTLWAQGSGIVVVDVQ